MIKRRPAIYRFIAILACIVLIAIQIPFFSTPVADAWSGGYTVSVNGITVYIEGHHGRMAKDALSNIGLTQDQINDISYACDHTDIVAGSCSPYSHRVTQYHNELNNIIESQTHFDWQHKCPDAEGAEIAAVEHLQRAREYWLQGKENKWTYELGCAIHYIQDALCPSHVLPFDEGGPARSHTAFEIYTNGNSYIERGWRNIVINAVPIQIDTPADLMETLVARATWVHDNIPCRYEEYAVFPNTPPIVWSHPEELTGELVPEDHDDSSWEMRSDDIGIIMDQISGLVKGATLWVTADGNRLSYPIEFKSTTTPGAVSLGVGNLRDMWYLVTVYQRNNGGYWQEMTPQPFIYPYLAPYAQKTFDYIPEEGKEIKIEVRNNLNDDTLAALYCLDYATRALLGISISSEVTDPDEFITKLLTFYNSYLNIGAYLVQGDYEQALSKIGQKLGEETAKLLIVDLLKDVGIQTTTAQVTAGAALLAFKYIVNAPVWWNLIWNANREPFYEEHIFSPQPPGEPVAADPCISQSLTLSPAGPYYVGQEVTAGFSIKNKGDSPITFQTLTAGGRWPAGGTNIVDFTKRYNITLNPDQVYNYEGSLILLHDGTYHFFCAYQTQDGSWETNVPVEPGLERERDIYVNTIPAVTPQPGHSQDTDTVNPVVTLKTPLGGETFVSGTQMRIEWNGFDNTGIVSSDIYFTTNNWMSYEKIGTVLQGTWYYDRIVPYSPTGQAAIKIVATDIAGNTGFASSGLFTISNTPSYPNLYISDISLFNNNPYVGEQITVGVTVRNNGDVQSGASKVKYYFSAYPGGRDIYLGESLIDPLNTDDASTTVYQSVTMPDFPFETAYIMAVTNPDSSIVEETYNDNYGSCQLTVRAVDNEAPQIGEFALRWGLGENQDEFKTCHEYSIVFHITDDIAVDTMDFQYSYDNGITWNTIVSDFVIGSNGFSNGYHWTVPEDAPLVETLRIKVIARDTSGKESVRVTDPLKIIDGAAPKIEILSPKGGEVWDLGSTHEITWNASASSGIAKVRIYVYFADTSEYISTELVNDGAYSWTLPVASGLVTDTGRIKIRVEDNNRNEAESWSNGYFSISDPSLPPPAPWSMPAVVTSASSGDKSTPLIAVDDNGLVHLIYQCEQGIEYMTYDGSGWSIPEIVNSPVQENHIIFLKDIAIDSDGNPHIVWEDCVGGGLTSANYNEVYYCCREGGIWSEPENISNNSNLADFEWMAMTNLPQAKQLASIAVVSDKIYVMGGDYRLSNYQYDTASNIWVQKADLPNNGVDEGGAAVVNGKIYVFGGPFDYEVMIYDPALDSWSTGSSMPTPRRGFCVAAVGNKVYLIGGSDNSNNPFDTVDCYDPATDSWSPKNVMPTPRGFASAAVVDDLIYVIGGCTTDGNSTNAVEVYNPSTNTWSTRSSMPTQRKLASIGVIGKQIYVVGGLNYYGNLNNVEMYYTTSDIWVSLNSAPTARYGAVGDVVNGKLYIIGGANDTGSLRTVERGILQGTSDENPTVSGSPRIAVDSSDNIHIVWNDGYSYNTDWTQNGISNLYHRIKESASSEFSPTEQITQEGGRWPAIVADDLGNLHLSFKSTSIFYMIWNSSTGWSGAAEAAPGTEHYLLGIDSDTANNLHLVWYNLLESTWQRIMYSSFNGSGWSVPEEVSERILDPIYPSVAADSSGWPHIVYEDSADSSVQYKRKSQVGWSEGIKLSLASQYVSQASSDMAISDDDQLYVVWVNQYNGHSEIFFTHADMSEDTIPPVANITAPALGEQLSKNTTYSVNWSATDNIGVNSISLDYVINGSTNDSVSIVTGIGNSGSHQWAVPNVSSDKVQIRITAYDLNGNAGTYFSDYFNISDTTPPSVSVITPNGGEEWAAGDQQKIDWEATDNAGVSSVNLLYSVDDGTNWEPIVSGLDNLGSYLWDVPRIEGSQYRIKVQALDDANNQGESISESTFTVAFANDPPNVPSDATPANGSVSIPIYSNLSWDGGDPDFGDTIKYDVYFGTNSTPPLVSYGQTNSTYQPGELERLTYYFWNIVATDSHGLTSYGPTWTFLTEAEPVPQPPSNLSTSVSPTRIKLSWTDNSNNELGFRIDRTLVGSNNSYLLIDSMPDSYITFSDNNLNPGANYYYRVYAFGNTGQSSYVEVNVTAPLSGDLNIDNRVNVLDLIHIGQRWGQTGAPGWIYEDVKPDGVINVLDMILIGQHWTG